MAITTPYNTFGTKPTKPKAPKPEDIFNVGDSTKQLGRDARSGIESQIADISKTVSNVNQRLQKEQQVRSQGIGTRAEEQRQKMARMFGIDPGGLAGGRAIRVAGTIGAEENRQREQLASEMGQREPQERAQALQLLSGLQRGQEQADLAAYQAGQQATLSQQAQDFLEYAQDRQMTNQELNDAVQREVVERRMTVEEADQILRSRAQAESEIQGAFSRGLSQQAQDFSESIGLRTMTMQEANAAVERAVANASITRDDADQLLRARAQLESERQGATQRQVALRQMDEQELTGAMQRAQARGESTGEFIDPETGQTFETLQAELGRKQAAVAERGISLQEAAQSDDVRLREYALELQNKIQSGQLTEEQARTQLQARQVRVQELQQAHEEIVDNRRIALEEQRVDIERLNSAVQRATAQGQATGTYVDPETGETIETLQSRLEEAQLNLQDRQLDLQAARDAGQLALGNREADIRLQDVTAKWSLGAQELEQRKVEFARNDIRRQNEFAEQMGLSRDEFEELKRKNEAGEEIENKRLEQALYQFEKTQQMREDEFTKDLEFRQAGQDFQQAIDRGMMTGEFEGQLTRQEAQRLWSNKQEEARLYGDEPPTILDNTPEAWQSVFNTQEGQDANYDDRYDMNGDGAITQEDFVMAQNFLNNGGADDIGGGNIMISKPGRTTLAQQQAGLDAYQVREQLDLKRDDMNRLREEFASMQTGYIMDVDEDGNMRPGWMLNRDTGQWEPATTMARDVHAQNSQRFNRDFNIQAVDLAERIGAIPSDPAIAKARFWDEVGSDGVIGNVNMYDLLGVSGAGNIQDAFRVYAEQQLFDEGTTPTQEAINNREASIAKQFLLNAINEDQQGAIAQSMAQVIFGANYQPPPQQPSQTGQIIGSIAGGLIGGLMPG